MTVIHEEPRHEPRPPLDLAVLRRQIQAITKYLSEEVWPRAKPAVSSVHPEDEK